MRSHLLEGTVRHRRARPFTYGLEHGVFYFALDLDELDEVTRSLRLVGRNRRSVVSFRDDDHFDPPAARRPRDASCDHLRTEGVDPGGWQVTLVTNLRVLGYVFNPASFYLCRDRRGRAAGRDRRGPQHPRRAPPVHPPRRGRTAPDLRRLDGQGVLRLAVHRAGRPLHGAGPRRAVAAADHDQRAPGRTASCSTRASTSTRRRLTDRMLLRMLLRHPLVTHKTIGHDPLARPAAVAARRPVPPPQGGRPMTARHVQPLARARRPRPARRDSPGAFALAAAARIRIGPPDASSCRTARRRSFGDAAADGRAEIHIHDTRALSGCSSRRRDRRRRGLHGRPVVQSRPRGPASLGRPATATRSRSRPAGSGRRRSSGGRSPTACAGTREARAAGTSRLITTWATTSTGCSSTRR